MGKKVCILTFVMALLLVFNSSVIAADDEVTVIYFYSSTCTTCHKLMPFFDSLNERYNNLKIIKYNIIDVKNKMVLDKYNMLYGVGEDDEGIVPIVFIGNQYFAREKNIRSNLENEILNKNRVETIIVDNSEVTSDINLNRFLDLKVLSIFFTGLINGINPCSMSMLIFFLSILVVVKKIDVLKIGISFCVGKFLMYFLLGTAFYKLLGKFNHSVYNIIVKPISLAIIIVFVLLNLQDFFSARNEKYNKIKLQLPLKLRKLNHSLIKKVSSLTNPKYMMLFAFALGSIICFGEFLCTGQVYLATIITVLQSNQNLNIKALSYLLLYDFAFIIPLLLITYIIYRGKEIFQVSEVIREKLSWIKLINVFVFLYFGVLIVLSF